MSLLNIFRGQLSSVIEWKDQSPNEIWHKFPSKENEIKNASKLIVNPGQGAVLVYEGKISDVIDKEGMYNLETDNHPFITTLTNLRQNFQSEHKLFIYFYRKAITLNQQWGTPSPVKYIDPVYKIPVEVGMYGNFSYLIGDVTHFFTNIVASKDVVTTEDIKEIIINRLPQLIASFIAQKKYSFQQIDSNLDLMSNEIKDSLKNEFEALGLGITDFRISGTQFDSKTVERIGSIADVTTGVQAAAEAGMSYVDLEKLRALRDAARNEGGLAGAGLQMGVGMEMGRKFFDGNTIGGKDVPEDVLENLKKLNILLKENIITQEEFDEKKKELLGKV